MAGAKAVPPELQAVLDAVRTRATAIGGVIADLRSAVKTRMTDEEVAAIVAALSGIETDLAGFAVDPDAPVPPTPVPMFKRR